MPVTSQVGQQLRAEGCYPVRSPFDLMMTSVQTMMDANLALQIKGALRAQPAPAAAPAAPAAPAARAAAAAAAAFPSAGPGPAPRPPASSPGFFDLAPEIITLCGGSLSPFDFALGKVHLLKSTCSGHTYSGHTYSGHTLPCPRYTVHSVWLCCIPCIPWLCWRACRGSALPRRTATSNK